MTCPDSARDDELFADALELPPAARLAFLDCACAGDPAQHARLVRLLAAHEEAADFLANLPKLHPPADGNAS